VAGGFGGLLVIAAVVAGLLAVLPLLLPGPTPLEPTVVAGVAPTTLQQPFDVAQDTVPPDSA